MRGEIEVKGVFWICIWLFCITLNSCSIKYHLESIADRMPEIKEITVTTSIEQDGIENDK